MKYLRSRWYSSQKRISSILGIETSCDDTGAAVINGNGEVIGEELASQTRISVMLGGVLPLVAKQLHSDNIDRVVSNALKQGNTTWKDLSAIAVTVQPGLAQSLKVGVSYAKEQAKHYNLPIIPVHHMEAHALTVRLSYPVEFPYLVLLISGGHSLLAIASDVDRFQLIGQGIDLSPGDCLEKLARRLKLSNLGGELASVSGGRAIEMLAAEGDPRQFPFNPPRSKYRDCNFSFSGIQGHAVDIIKKEVERHGCQGNAVIPTVRDFCASLQLAMAQAICRRVQRGLVYADRRELMPLDPKQRCLVVSGGVAANQFIRNCLEKVCHHHDYQLICPPPRLCTDNGVMIAWNGFELYRRGLRIVTDIDSVDFCRKAPLGEDLTEDVVASDIKLGRIKLLD